MKQFIHMESDAEALATFARDWLVERMAERHASSPTAQFSLALSGGSTPKRLYQLLAELPAGRVDWHRVLLVWGDERTVAAEHSDSNYRMVRESLLEHIDIPSENVLAVPQPAGDPKLAAENYEALLRERLQPINTAGFPALDCVLLGMGEDVHTASLFPGTRALHESSRWVVENHVPQLDSWRITLTAPMINSAARVAFLLSGSGKQPALEKLWHASHEPEQYPSQLIRPTTGDLWFLADRAAIAQVRTPDDAIKV